VLAVFHLDVCAWSDLGVRFEKIPPRQRRHPENILLGVVVADFQLFNDRGIVITKVVVIVWIAELSL
jgi:hypothetical protein